MPEEDWTEVKGHTSNTQLIIARIEALETKIGGIETQLKEILGHCRQQSIIQRASLPFSGREDPDVHAARAANLALRKKVPIPFYPSHS